MIAVDPVAFKREMAESVGATHTFSNMQEATEFAQSVTNGQGADATIVTTGVLKTEHVSEAFASTACAFAFRPQMGHCDRPDSKRVLQPRQMSMRCPSANRSCRLIAGLQAGAKRSRAASRR